MKRFIRDYFTFSSREKTGILVLLFLVMLVMGLNLFLRHFTGSAKEYDYSSYKRQIEEFRSSIGKQGSRDDIEKEINSPSSIRLFPFNPNTVTRDSMIQLGISREIAGRMLAYRKKGGRFRKKEDLMKIYGFDRMTYAALKPYITLETVYESRADFPEKKKVIDAEPLQIEINSSDTTELKKLRGIGSVLALRLIRYRNILGGFYDAGQMTEVYGINDSLFQSIKDYLFTDTALIRTIAVNEATESQLSRHPYIGNYTAKAIVALRKSTGRISSIKDLTRNKIISSDLEDRLKYYLVFN